MRTHKTSPDHLHDMECYIKFHFKDGVLKGLRKMKSSYPKGFFEFSMNDTYGGGNIFETRVVITINQQALLTLEAGGMEDLVAMGMFEEQKPQVAEGKFMLFMGNSNSESTSLCYHAYHDSPLSYVDGYKSEEYLKDSRDLKDIPQNIVKILTTLLTKKRIIKEEQ